jgi:two-component system sensor histidine kinase DesK
LGHNLSVIALKTQVARRTLDTDPAAATSALNDAEAVARQSLQDVRQLVSGYRQRSLGDELAAADELLTAAGIRPVIQRPDALPGGRAEELLAWALREGTTNVIRHSQASRCCITITEADDQAHLEVADDGASPSVAVGGCGLQGLAERLRDAGGGLDAGPAPEGGFRLTAHVPL